MFRLSHSLQQLVGDMFDLEGKQLVIHLLKLASGM